MRFRDLLIDSEIAVSRFFGVILFIADSSCDFAISASEKTVHQQVQLVRLLLKAPASWNTDRSSVRLYQRSITWQLRLVLRVEEACQVGGMQAGGADATF